MKHIKFSIAAIFCIYAITGGCDSGNNNKPATVFSSAIAKKDDTLTLNLCGVEGGAYNIPWSVDLPEAQDIPGFPDTTALINFLQNRFDELSWKTFIALNWPSLENGDPDSTTCFTKNTGIAVWESWMPSSKIFVPAGQTPAPWKTGTLKAAAYYGVSAAALAGGSQKPGNIHPANSGTFATLRIGKVDSAFTILDAEQFPVIDKNHMYTLFENFYNKEAYDYIVKSKLYSRAGQKEFTKNWPSFTKGLTMTSGNKTINIESAFKRAYFPVGNFKDSSKVIGDTTYTFSKNEGAIIIKSAWIVL
ncbi:MAG TPA: hypothetical protein PLA68_18430, partial [Panacibacter sp.]|nr:hypothetical protein [Panacibacter sp.]